MILGVKKIRSSSFRLVFMSDLNNHFKKFGRTTDGKVFVFQRRTLVQVGASLLIAAFFWSTLILAEKKMVEVNLLIKIFTMKLDFLRMMR